MQILFYVLTFLIIFLINVIGLKYYSNDKSKLTGRIFIAIGFIALLCLIGFRYEVGTDFNSYLNQYITIKNLALNELFSFDWEYGAVLIFKLTSLIFKNDYMMFFIIGLFTLYPIYKANKIYEYKYLPYSILVFCFVFLPFCMNGMRQGIAMNFMLLSFIYLINDHKKNCIINAIIAFLFHKSIILFFPYLIIYLIFKDKRYEKYSIIITAIISIIILFFFKDLISIGEFNSYTYILENINVNNISYKTVLLYIPILIILFLFNKKSDFERVIGSLLISGIIFDVTGSSARFLSRISYYFLIFEILLIPYLIQNIKNKSTRVSVKVLYICYLIAYFIFSFYIWNKHGIFPYKTWIFY